MNIKSIQNNTTNFGAGFSPEIRQIFQNKIAEALKQNPDKETEIATLVQNLRYSYFPSDIYVIAKSNNNKSSMYGRLALQNTKSRTLSDLLDTDIYKIEKNVRAMAIEKNECFDIDAKSAETAKRIIDKYA